MRIGELARRAGVTIKTIRYYERLGLVTAARAANGYRDFDESQLRVATEVRDLSAAGITPGRAAPFVDCLDAGHDHGDECVSSLVVYRDTIRDLDRQIAFLTSRRDQLEHRLARSAARPFNQEKDPMTDYTALPGDLPVPEDDGAADHLPGVRLPSLELPTSDGERVDLGDLGPGRTVIYLYPLTGQPGVDLPEGWDAIPGARGCSTEACDFRDHFEELRQAGVDRVFGLSSQSPTYQAELVDRLHLPFTMVSDESLRLADSVRLPTFTVEPHGRLYARLTLVVTGGLIEHVFYPIFPPNTHAQQVLQWLREHAQTSL